MENYIVVVDGGRPGVQGLAGPATAVLVTEFASVAALNASLDYAADSLARVGSQYYRKTGDVGSGGWATTDYDPLTEATRIFAQKVDIDGLLIPRKNLIDKSKIRRGFQHSVGASGIISTNSTRMSGFIPVTEGLAYTLSGADTGGVYYYSAAEDDAWVSNAPSSVNGVVPVGQGITHAVVNITNDGIDVTTYDDTVQFEQSSSATAYEPFNLVIDPSKNYEQYISRTEALETFVSEAAFDAELELKMDIDAVGGVMQLSKNLINPDDIRAGFYHSPSAGGIVASTSWRCTGFIPVTEGEAYTFSGYEFGGVHYYSAADDNAFVSSGSNVNGVVPTGQGITHAVGNITNDGSTVTAFDATVQFELGAVATPHVPYGFVFNDDNIPDDLVSEDEIFEFDVFNLIDTAKVGYDTRYSTGSRGFVNDTFGLARTDWIAVTEGEFYTLSQPGVFNLGGTPQGGYFDAYGAAVAVSNIVFSDPVEVPGAPDAKIFQVPTGQGITHVVISLLKAGQDPAATTLEGVAQMELGEAPTAYRAHAVQKFYKAEFERPDVAAPSGGDFNAAAWFTFVDADGGSSRRDKLARTSALYYGRDGDLVAVMTGTSLTARSNEHCPLHPDATVRPPLMHSYNFASYVWDAFKWDNQSYRRYDAAGHFTESGPFATATNLPEWDDGPYRAGLTRYSDDAAASVSFDVPVDAWQHNFIYRTDTQGAGATISIAEGNLKMEVFNEAIDDWVEANGFTFSMRELVDDPRDVLIPSGNTGNLSTHSVTSKSNTHYQKRLKMRTHAIDGIDSRDEVKSVTITSDGTGRFMYWGCEWSPRQYMATLINSSRGSHNTQADGSAGRGLPLFADNEVHYWRPTLLISELFHNDGAGGSGFSLNDDKWGILAENYIWRDDFELSIKTRAAFFNYQMPELALMTASIAVNFGGINPADGTLNYSAQGDGEVMTALDKYNEAYHYIVTNHPDAGMVNAADRWVKAGIAMFGDLNAATVGSGKDGATFTNEGSHWNQTGSKIMAKVFNGAFLDFSR